MMKRLEKETFEMLHEITLFAWALALLGGVGASLLVALIDSVVTSIEGRIGRDG